MKRWGIGLLVVLLAVFAGAQAEECGHPYDAVSYRYVSAETCERYCTACEETLDTYEYEHSTSCDKPGVCEYCGYESENIPVRHVEYGAEFNDKITHVVCCVYCGETFDIENHYAYCFEPGVCFCGYESDAIIMQHEGISGMNEYVDADTCGAYCYDCDAVISKNRHSAFCSSVDFCFLCYNSDVITEPNVYHGYDIEWISWGGDLHDYVVLSADDNGHQVECDSCGEIKEGEHRKSACNDPNVCYVCDYVGGDVTADYHNVRLFIPVDGLTHAETCSDCGDVFYNAHTPSAKVPSICDVCGADIDDQPTDSRESAYAPVYDYDYYLSNNPDLAAAFGSDRTAAMDHFIDFGMDEGRPSSAEFSWTIYRANYPELEAVFGNTTRSYYEHYIAYGKAEGRVANQLIAPETPEQPADSRESAYAAVYNYDYYTGKYPDVVAAFNGDRTATLDQFINYGMAEGRQGSSSFNVDCYRENYPDLQAVFGSDLKAYYNHYINHGKAEGRVANQRITPEQPSAPETDPNAPDSRESYYAPVYDFDYYVGHYADVAAAFGGDRTATLDQFINYGMSEGRQGSAEFNVKTYRANYPDLEAVFGGDLEAYYKHYINYGKAEGRSGK